MQQVIVNGTSEVCPRGQGPLLREHLQGLRNEGWEQVSDYNSQTSIFQRLSSELGSNPPDKNFADLES